MLTRRLLCGLGSESRERLVLALSLSTFPKQLQYDTASLRPGAAKRHLPADCIDPRLGMPPAPIDVRQREGRGHH